MSDKAMEQLRELVARWRNVPGKNADVRTQPTTRASADTYAECADELETAIAAERENQGVDD